MEQVEICSGEDFQDHTNDLNQKTSTDHYLKAEELSGDIDEIISGFEQVLQLEKSWLNLWSMTRLVNQYFGNRIEVGDASYYIFHFARKQGYDIPPFPFEGSGEIKKFFADQGVKNVPDWYAKQGVSFDTYHHLHEKTLVAFKRRDGQSKLIFLDGIYYVQDFGFRNLVESEFMTKAPPSLLKRILKELFVYILDGDDTC